MEFLFFKSLPSGKHLVRLVAVTLATSLTFWSQNVSAALVGFDTIGDYQTAIALLSGTESNINFDSLGGGSLGSVGDVTFSSSGAGLSVYATDGITDDTISRDNYIGNTSANPAFFPLENETVTISFAAPRAAVGVFVIRPGAAGSAQITANSFNQSQGNAMTATALAAGYNAYFMGIVDNSGGNSISQFTLQDAGGTGYFFDSQVSFMATAVPEPSCTAAIGCLVVGLFVRRHRHAKAFKKH